MKWTELAIEILKQPEWLREKEVAVDWDYGPVREALAKHGLTDPDLGELDLSNLCFTQLVSPENDCEDASRWVDDGAHLLELCVTPKQKQKKPYRAHFARKISVSFKAESDEQAALIAETLAKGVTDDACMFMDDAMLEAGSDELVQLQDDSDYAGYADVVICDKEIKKILEDEQ